MNNELRRGCLVLLALYAAYTGFWGYFAPRSWYDHFPGFSMSWLPPMGPYNEHFAKDINAMYLGLLVLTLVVLFRVSDEHLVSLTAWGWLTFNVLHLIYHVRHLGMLESQDRVPAGVALGLVTVFSALLLLPRRNSVRPSRREVEA